MTLKLGQRIGEVTVVEFLDEPNTGLARIESCGMRFVVPCALLVAAARCERIEAAARVLWLSRRPVDYTTEQHTANPLINAYGNPRRVEAAVAAAVEQLDAPGWYSIDNPTKEMVRDAIASALRAYDEWEAPDECTACNCTDCRRERSRGRNAR